MTILVRIIAFFLAHEKRDIYVALCTLFNVLCECDWEEKKEEHIKSSDDTLFESTIRNCFSGCDNVETYTCVSELFLLRSASPFDRCLGRLLDDTFYTFNISYLGSSDPIATRC